MSPELRTELLRGIFESASQRPYWEQDISIIGSINIDSDAQSYESYFLFLMDLYDSLNQQYESKTDIVATVLKEELEELDKIAFPLFFWDQEETSRDSTRNNIPLLQQHINKLRNDFDVPVKTFMSAKLHQQNEKPDGQESLFSFATVTTLSTLQYSAQSSRSNSPFEYDEDVDYSNNSSAKSNSDVNFF